MSSGRYAPLATSSSDSVDHQYREESFAERGFGSGGRQGNGHYGQQREVGLVEKGKRQYWTGKQYVREKMGKEQDQFQVADDAELDSQMERARHIQKQCFALCKALLQYQEVVQQLTSRQVALSSLLRAYAESETDGPCAEMMSRLGTVMQDEAVQRLELDVPLTRFFSEVETFRRRALVDTLVNVSQVMLERRKFRGALLWMADASRNLDPDTQRQLAKFRQAQQMARESRREFEGKKGTVCEKVDLLAASFCNLLSHAMTPYTKALGVQWGRSAGQYSELLEWSRETLRHQYRLQRDVQRERERQKTVGTAGDGDRPQGGDGDSEMMSSESWSEGRMLSVLGEAPTTTALRTVEHAHDALAGEGEEDRKTPTQDEAKTAESEATVPDANQHSDNAQDTPKEDKVAATSRYPDYSWLELMTEGSAAGAMADFASHTSTSAPSAEMQSQVKTTLLNLARVSTTATEAGSRETVGELGSGAGAGAGDVDLLAYEMAGQDQALHGITGMQQLTNDEAQLEKVLPVSSVLRHRQQQDMRAETQLEKELAQMVDEFSSLSAAPQGASYAFSTDTSALDSLFPFLTPAGYGAGPGAPGNLPGEVGDMASMDSMFGLPENSLSTSRSASTAAHASAEYRATLAGGNTVASESGSSSASAAAPSSATSSSTPAEAGGAQSGGSRQKWFDLFAELDPLANPDDLNLGEGTKSGQVSDDNTTKKLAL